MAKPSSKRKSVPVPLAERSHDPLDSDALPARGEDPEADEVITFPTAEAQTSRLLDRRVYGEPVIHTLLPPDLHQCQCEWPDTSVQTFGPRPLIRCEAAPTVVAFQLRHPDADTPTGAIALCDTHRILLDHMYPDQCYFRRLTSDHALGEVL
jgi:hypothetical protein